MKTSITVQRDDLYTWIWSEPITKMATRMGVRYTDLVDACEKLNVPRPKPGYWGCIQRGQIVTKKPLPTESSQNSIEISTAPLRKPRASSKQPPKEESHSFEATSTIPKKTTQNHIPTDLRGCHPIVSSTRKALEAQKADSEGYVSSFSKNCFDVWINKTSIRRTLLICETIIRTCEASGIKFKQTGDRGMIDFDYGKDSFGFAIKERRRRIDIPPSERKYEWGYKYRYEATGKLSLEIDEAKYYDGIRSKWSDGNVQKLEDVIGNFVEYIPRIADFSKQRRLEREEQSRRSDYMSEQRYKLKRRIDREKQRREQLEELTAQWKHVTRLREFCEAVESADMPEIGSKQKEQWMVWAKASADWKDPFLNGTLNEQMQATGHEPELDCTINTWHVKFPYPGDGAALI